MRREPLLRRKLLTWLLVPLSLLLISDMFISYWVALSFSQRAYDRTLLEIAREVSLRIGGANGHIEFDMPEAVREVLFNDPSDTLYYEVSASNGKVIAGDPIGVRGARPIKPQQENYYDATVHGVPVRVVELHVRADAALDRPAATVRVAETITKRAELTREILLSVLLPQVLLILLAGAIVWAGVVRGLAPLDKVRRAVALRSHRERGPVPAAEVPGEVRPLVDAVNGLLERLDHVLTLQARFVTDAAHQLKTPVAGLQAQMELALRETDPERIRESMQRLYRGLERLARLVSQLLSLARNEPDAVRSVILKPLDLNALALDAATSWVPAALGKGIDLGLESSESAVMIRGDPGRLRELFDNLLDNAVRYTPHGGRVTVRVARDPAPGVAVSDDGPAIPPHERARVFERFHRLLGTSHDGSGLGLAIALEIARLHGADIVLEDDKDGIGNTFTVSFPHP
ncbi:MAG TPA: sensor histidine kinase N-terminal domain-containing protein [Burkholderiales bacterium]|nr:sensor histidine kinase N-terminal domain-containing protein [Burkholderiales bacterium]